MNTSGTPPPDSLDVSIIIPTFNEAENIALLVPRLEQVLTGLDYEVIVFFRHGPNHWTDIIVYPKEKTIEHLDSCHGFAPGEIGLGLGLRIISRCP